MRKNIKKAAILLIWLVLWQIAAVFVSNPIYFASPADTVSELLIKVRDAAFWASVGGSLLRILSGFFAAFILAFAASFISLRFIWFGEFLAPFVSFLKSVPVAAVVVILLIWWGPRYLVLCISLMIVFPNIYSNMLTGLEGADKSLREMASVFKMRPFDRFLWIYRPAYLPYLHSAASVSLGMGFKSGIAAEIIGLPDLSVGERLYRDKIYLNTAGVFAWVIVILIVSSLTEHLLIYMLKKLAKVPSACLRERPASKEVSGKRGVAPMPASEEDDDGFTVASDGVRKAYDGRIVTDTCFELKRGRLYCIKGASGAGKTTLLSIMAGILVPDSGCVRAGRLSMVFQDERLIESANGLRNLKIAGCTGDLAGELAGLLPERTVMLPASELSGGERRRLSIARALLHPSDAVIMDEPFAGLDKETRHRTADWILEHLDGRTLIFTSHESDPESLLDAEEIPLINK